jgi:hypothetical protein
LYDAGSQLGIVGGSQREVVNALAVPPVQVLERLLIAPGGAQS